MASDTRVDDARASGTRASDAWTGDKRADNQMAMARRGEGTASDGKADYQRSEVASASDVRLG